MTTLNAGEGKVLDADHLAEIIATHMDMFYVSGSPPAGAKSAAQAILTALRTPSEEMERAWQQLDPVRFDHGLFHQAHAAAIDVLLTPKAPDK